MDKRHDTRFGVADLAEAAGVSVRTIRYYIAEGLLPPPEERGPGASYTTGHLDRLRLIGRLKDAYLPLREIRRRLDGLDDAAVRELLARLGPGRPPSPPVDESPPTDSAAEYLARVMGSSQRARGSTVRATARPSPARPGSGPPEPPGAVGIGASPPEQDSRNLAALGQPAPVWPASSGGTPADSSTEATASEWLPPLDLDPALALVAPPEPSPAGEGPWRRIALGADAELLVREEAYQRRRDRIEWLVGWARKVFKD